MRIEFRLTHGVVAPSRPDMMHGHRVCPVDVADMHTSETEAENMSFGDLKLRWRRHAVS